MKEREMNLPDFELRKETVETKLLSEIDIDQMVEQENGAFDETLRASKETITERLRLGHHMIGAYDGEKLIGMISFSYANADPDGFIDVPTTATEFSRQPMAKEHNAAIVYNLSVLPEYRGRDITQELVRAMTKQAKQDQCLFAVGEGRIPSYNGSDSEINGVVRKKEEVHKEINIALREKKMPSEEVFLKDPLLKYYKKIFDDMDIAMTFVRLIPDFSPADVASGGLRVLFKVELEEKQKVSLSEEWAELSAALCGPEFIRSLGNFFKSKGIHTVLECACGDGHVLYGLANEGMSGIGIDSDEYLITRAHTMHSHQNIQFQKADVLNIDQVSTIKDRVFDAVMCRGNSLASFGAWGATKETFNPERSESEIREGLRKMWSYVKKGGMLYLDITRQEDINRGDHQLLLDFGGINLIGEIAIDREHRRRDAFGRGTIHGKPFEGGSSSYLMGPEDLKSLVDELLKPKKIWTPAEISDAMYEVICVEK